MNFKLSVSIFIIWSLSGCVNNPSYQPLDVNTPKYNVMPSNTIKSSQYHIVTKGETLYSIAMQYDLDYKVLASTNKVRGDYNIVPGQRLNLKLTKKTDTPIVVNNQKESNKSPVNKVQQQNNPVNYTKNKPVIKLNWPLEKTIVRTSASIVRQLKGIDIRSEIGDSVLAAADGEVVFAGSGLRGYGNLIIIQHTDDILTAYAYTKEILVKEKQLVKTGDRIATVGSNGPIKESALHFEVRKNGKPLDPLAYLPK